MACGDPWPGNNPWQPWVQSIPYTAPVAPLQYTHYHFTPAPLSDADVERIAKRVAELLRAGTL